MVLGSACTALRLAGQCGQLLSHAAELWMAPLASGGFEALLRLAPLVHGQGGWLRLARAGPLGWAGEVWGEVPMVELPCLFRLTLARSHNSAVASAEPFLVMEEEETLAIHCWQRKCVEGEEGSTEALMPSFKIDPVGMEQLIWCDTVAALAEMPPCAEAPVPAARLRLADEGLASRGELLSAPGESPHGVPQVDAPRLASLAFLRQYVECDVLEEEVLPRLFPSGGGMVRVLSAELAPPIQAHDGRSVAPTAGQPGSLDELFGESCDFRAPALWAAGHEDPLMHHELTSVFLLNEHVGIMLAFHCLEASDPCST